MVEIVVVGSFGIDSITTPFKKVDNLFGGSAPYAAYSASFFSDIGIVSVKGDDINDEELEFLRQKNISLEGLQTKGKTFRWTARYDYDLNDAETLKVEMNSLSDFNPIVPENYRNARYLFLANNDPEKQLKVIEQMGASFILLDTHKYWIENKKDKLIDVIKKVNTLIINEWEARELFSTPNLIKAANSALALGVESVIIKKGEHGALLFTKNEHFSCPGYPLENVIDPTGCGDCFGGAFIGYYARSRDIRKSMVYGAVIASFNAESFGIERLKNLSMQEIEERYKEMQKIREF